MMVKSILFLLMACVVFAQDNKNTADQPLDLQEFVITGKTNADIKGGSKLKPQKPGLLTKIELDSINTDLKIPMPLLPFIPLPVSSLQTNAVTGFLNGEFGLFVTPKIDAGYSFNSGGYAVDILANLERSSGHLDNADFSKMGCALNARYDAPKKFVFFGGSRTESQLSYASSTFRLFGVDRSNMIERTVNDIGANVHVKGTVGEYAYSMGALWQSLSIQSDTLPFSDSRIKGFVDFTAPVFGLDMKSSLMVDLHSYGDSSSYSFIQAGVSSSWTRGDISIRGGLDLQTATNTESTQFGAIQVHADVDYRMSSDFTGYMQFQTGLANTSLSELLSLNPYLMHDPVISFRRDDITISPMLQWHPDIDLSASFKATYRSSSNIPVMVPNSIEAGRFAGFSIEYLSGNILDIRLESQWKAFKHTILGAFGSYVISSLNNTEKQIPMIAPTTIGLRFERVWAEELRSLISIEHVGARSILIDGSQELPAYIMANVRLDYTVQKDFDVYVRIDNLLNASVYLWNRFRERGTFAALGARYLF